MIISALLLTDAAGEEILHSWVKTGNLANHTENDLPEPTENFSTSIIHPTDHGWMVVVAYGVCVCVCVWRAVSAKRSSRPDKAITATKQQQQQLLFISLTYTVCVCVQYIYTDMIDPPLKRLNVW